MIIVKLYIGNISECAFVGKFLMSSVNRKLELDSNLNVNEYIELTDESPNKGIYKVISLGSDKTPWVLERI